MEGTFMMNVLVFLGAAIMMVPFVKKIGLSSVIGYILGGIIIGPFVLKLSGQSENVEDVMHTTEFGVVMLLFLVGLELEPKKFWAMRKRIIGLGLSQMLLTVLVLYFVFTLLGWSSEVAVGVAMCFAMSSTAIVMQTLQEKNMFRTVAGEASFSTLLFQDIAVIPILAILPLIANHPPEQEGGEVKLLIQNLPEWMQAFTLLIGIMILILLGRFVFVPFLRYVSKSGMSELFTASSLFLVIGVSELMNAIGLSPALGAFLAGVMLANSEFRHELEAQIDPFKGLLLAVFFVSVGASVNFNIIKENPALIFGIALMVLVVKFLILFGIGKFFKIKKPQNLFYAFALSQAGEFAFVLLNFSAKLHLVNEELNAQMMAVTAITMCATPFLLVLNDRITASHLKKEKICVEDDYDVLKEDIPQKKIIIVGFGYFGSTVGRLLKASKISATILDHDPERVRLLRGYGFKAYFGDATRVQILRAAGIQSAEILVLCLDNLEDNKFIADYVRHEYPNVKIFVRVKNRMDAYDYVNNGIDNIYRETLGTAVDMAVDVLAETGMRKYMARRLGNRFVEIDESSVKKLASEQLKETPTFTVHEILQKEEDLLRADNLNFDTRWTDDDPILKYGNGDGRGDS